MSLDADSDDFELKLNTEASDEVALGTVPKDPSGSGKPTGQSGITCREPADSGISLEKGKEKGKSKNDADKSGEKKPDGDSDVDFELTLDSSSAPPAVKLDSSTKGKKDADSDSEFELTLDDSGGSSIEHAALGAAEAEAEKGDIFETDFEIPPMDNSDSGSEAVALESDTDLEKSDFDVAIDDSDVISEDVSGSEVVLLEDEAPAAKAKGRKKSVDEVDLAAVDAEDEEVSASRALKGVKGRRTDEEEEEEAAMAVPAGAYRPVPWGPVPGIFLALAFPFMLIGGIMGYQLIETMWGYQQPRNPPLRSSRNWRNRSTWNSATSEHSIRKQEKPTRKGGLRRRRTFLPTVKWGGGLPSWDRGRLGRAKASPLTPLTRGEGKKLARRASGEFPATSRLFPLDGSVPCRPNRES